MTKGGGDTGAASVVEGHHAAVGQWQLHLAYALLAGHLTRHGAVYLVGQPVLAGHSLELQHILHVFVEMIERVGDVLIMMHHGDVAHNGLGRMAEHLSHVEVERLHAVALHKRKVSIAGGLTHDIHRGALALGNLLYMAEVFLINQ